MRFPGTRTERSNLLVAVISCVAGVVALGWSVYTYIKPPAPTPESAQTNGGQVISQEDEQSRAQALRAVANSFRALSAERVNPQSSSSWQTAETYFQKANELYSRGQFADAANCFDKAQRAFNDIYSAFEASKTPVPVARIEAAEKLKAFIAKMDREIAKLEKDRAAASPLEAGAAPNEEMRRIEAQIQRLLDLKADANRRLMGTFGG